MRLQSHSGIFAIPALFAVASAIGNGSPDSDKKQTEAVSYGDGFYGQLTGASSNAVFTISTSQAITFAVRSGVSVNGVTMYRESNVVAVQTTPPTVATPTPTPSASHHKRTASTSPKSAASASPSGSTSDMGAKPLELSVPYALPNTSANINVSVSFNSEDIVNGAYSTLFHFKVDWTDDLDSGFTESQDLIYVNDAAAAVAAVPLLSAFTTQAESTTGTASSTSSASTTSTGTTTTGTTASTKSTSSSLPNSSSSNTAAPAKSSKGLAGGAIAGIVVGIVALLLIAGVAAFFLLRRRKNASAPAGGYRGSGSEQIGLQSGFASAAVVEKDAFSGGGAHSPYTDEASYVAASAPVSAAPAPVSAAAAAAAPAPPPKQAVSNQVAALIEDHMTPDEIARLAAEEEELDAAIAKAHRSRQASQA